eukprot:CAMPEP_0170082336 /NCGR_PEP_ID=MMETSP0019_2-20121128/17964_1 /TAXON_ID=98059 /ORGANISM="Dinobryon sp., Strain UTEXLB2267" /LENGTH=316 /DNA_ID=CAMNT_0010297185 /DNA_START=461 /DNA_END=1412 /DNA_ORIENTATION=+
MDLIRLLLDPVNWHFDDTAPVDPFFPVNLPDLDGTLPLIHACTHNTTADVTRLLLTRWPQSLIKEDPCFKRCAVHHAALRGVSEAPLKALLEVEPTCAYLEGHCGGLPLHDAVRNVVASEATQLALVELLLAANPFAAMKPLHEDTDDNTTTNHTNDNKNSSSIDLDNNSNNNHDSNSCDDVDRTVNVSSSANSNSFIGALPLHLAVWSSSVAVVQAVYRSYPEAVFSADCEGLLPIHYFSLRSNREQASSLEVVEFILQANPQSLITLDSSSNSYHSAVSSASEEAAVLAGRVLPPGDALAGPPPIPPRHPKDDE